MAVDLTDADKATLAALLRETIAADRVRLSLLILAAVKR
jgi:hypothetical protein